MDEDIIEDSMNKESDDSNIKTRWHQLECEVLRLQSIIQDERSKNKELELTLNYFQQLYRKEKDDKDEAQSAFNKVIGSLWVSDQTRASNGRRSEEIAYTISPTFKLTNHLNERVTMGKSSKLAFTKLHDRQISLEKKNKSHTSIQNANISHISVNSPQNYTQKQNKSITKSKDDKKKVRKAKSRKLDRKAPKLKLNQSMNNPNFYSQVTQDTWPNGTNYTF